MSEYTNVLIQEYQYDEKEQAFAALAPGGELHPVTQDGYTDADGRLLTQAQIEWLAEVGKWFIRLVFGIPIP